MHTHFKDEARQLVLCTSNGIFFFSPEDIVRLEAQSNYTTIFFSNRKKMMTSKVLKEFVQMLQPLGFVRTHRTHLINRKHILCVTPDGNIIMKDSSVAGISRRMRNSVMKELKQASC